MFALAEGEKPRFVDQRVVVYAPPVVFAPIPGSQLSLHVRSRQDLVTASSVSSYVDTSSIGLFLVPVEEPLPLQYKNSVKMRTAPTHLQPANWPLASISRLLIT